MLSYTLRCIKEFLYYLFRMCQKQRLWTQKFNHLCSFGAISFSIAIWKCVQIFIYESNKKICNLPISPFWSIPGKTLIRKCMLLLLIFSVLSVIFNVLLLQLMNW